MIRRVAAVCSLAVCCWSVSAQEPRQQYPEGSAIPRSSTPAEADWLARHPLEAPDAVTPPPTGPLHCPAEYEPMAAILVSWEGPLAWTNLLRDMALHITTTGNADMHIAVDTAGEVTVATNTFVSAGINMARVKFIVRATDSIWIRDYGPRFIYQGDCRAVVDHTYNQPRPLDDAFTSFYAPSRGHPFYELPLVHGGGNYHLDALGRSRTTRLIVNENPGRTEQQIHDIWEAYQDVDTTFYQPFPRTVDLTQHIDMWMQVVADDVVMISDWPANPGSIQDNICEAAATSMAAEGFTVFRVPARSIGGVHYTYTNVVMCNDVVLIPSYTHTTVAPHNAEALAAWRAAAPSKTIVQLNCQGIVSAAGVMHCIVMHVPVPRGGLNPTAYLVNFNGGQVLRPGSVAEIQWISDDDEAVQTVDLQLSLDGGASFPIVIATGLPRLGVHAWTVPDVCSRQARIRVIARDAGGRSGSDDGDGVFAVSGTGCATSISYGTGTPGLLGVPQLSSTDPILGAPVSLDLSAAWPGLPALMLFGATPASVPFAGSTLLVAYAGHIGLTVSPIGTASLGFVVPAEPALSGVSLFWQAWVPDATAAGGWATTAGLQMRFGP